MTFFDYLQPVRFLSCRTPRHANINIDLDRWVANVSLNSDLEYVSFWGSNNHVTFDASKTFFLIFPKTSFFPLTFCPLSHLFWIPRTLPPWLIHYFSIVLVFISEHASRAAHSWFFPLARHFFTPQILHALKHYSYTWDGTSYILLSLLDRV